MNGKRAKSYKLTNETKARVRIVAAQSFLTEDEVVEKAIDLIYGIAPEDRDARIDLDHLISATTAKLNSFSENESKDILDEDVANES